MNAKLQDALVDYMSTILIEKCELNPEEVQEEIDNRFLSLCGEDMTDEDIDELNQFTFKLHQASTKHYYDITSDAEE